MNLIYGGHQAWCNKQLEDASDLCNLLGPSMLRCRIVERQAASSLCIRKNGILIKFRTLDSENIQQ